ncbi:hypothetical protein [Rhizobium tumorigenes]|uniref:Uncharacterized protein n=1 Tax=Rhizobium tumorigenes TaxID=2041385 RepID=A0AAF1KBC9_9HYPH|nr:hypothetical protein [Rhizobium tumorigenes]WFR98990.1 hypothetical protein PR017_26800 [Rhizobium tumorigenes]
MMFLKLLAASTLALSMATAVVAEPLTLRVTPKGPRVVTVYSAVIDHSKDAISPSGIINVDLPFTGTTNRTPTRIQCDSNPTTSVMRSNTFDAAPLSDCP